MSQMDAQEPPFDVAKAPYVNLATFRKSGIEVRTPVWIASVTPASGGPRHYVFSERTAGKVKRIRNNGRARIARCDFFGKVSSDWIDVNARIVEDTETIARAYRALHAKYGLRMAVADFFSKLNGRYDRRAMLELSPLPER